MRRVLVLLAASLVAIVAAGCTDNSTENYQPPKDDRSPGGNAPRPALGVGGGPGPKNATQRRQ